MVCVCVCVCVCVQQAAIDIEAKEREMKARGVELQQRLSAMQDASQREPLEGVCVSVRVCSV